MQKTDSKIIAGTAIILMIFLHLLAGDMYPRKSIMIDDSIITSIAQFGKICVSLFAFISGYGLWKIYQSQMGPIKLTGINFIQKTAKIIFIRIKKFLIVYWPICLLGAIIKVIYEHEFSLIELLKNAIGKSWSYNYTWWYVRYYIIMLAFIYPCALIIIRQLRKIQGGGIHVRYFC